MKRSRTWSSPMTSPGDRARPSSIQTVTVGGIPIGNPTLITSVPNAIAAIDGNNAQVRVILDGNQTGGSTGLVLARSQSIIRGLAIEGFGVGISVPDPTDVGDLIQGNSIGEYLVYPVDPQTGDRSAVAEYGRRWPGSAIPRKGSCSARPTRRWVVSSPRTANVICGNGAQGVLIEPGRIGQPGARQPDRRRRAVDDWALFPGWQWLGRGRHPVDLARASDPASIVYSSSNVIGGAVAGRATSSRPTTATAFILSGVGATRNLVEANYIGAAPGGGYVFGNGTSRQLG